jgi:leucyl-tRNA synthetase
MYDHQTIEKKWQDRWRKEGIYRTEEENLKPKYYVLDMFPYPSGAGLHAGHVESYTATDIYSRYFRAKGFNVLHPQGFDAFGLPAENYAIKTGVHPTETIKKAMANFRTQIDSLGFSYDWEKMVNTSDPDYYKWTQWLFLLMYKEGLAYKKKAKANWCPSCQTVLANEQAEGGICERCGSQVVQKDLEQWFFKITDFIEDQESGGKKSKGLLNGLDDIDWPASTKAAQRNWIGRSEGAEINFQIKDSKQAIQVFTTRLDTIFGCTYVVLAPESQLITDLRDKIKNRPAVEEYLAATKIKTELQRTDLNKDKTGVILEGVEAINPFTGQAVKVYAADYVLASYGTGAVMAVPAHDERDFAFAKKYGLEIRTSIVADKEGGENEAFFESAYTEDGFLVNSGEFSGLDSEEARQKMGEFLEASKIGRRQVNYRLRDWLVSRQRYWGAPIPIIYCDHCGIVPVPEKDLPVLLPSDVDFRPTGESPLKYSASFQDVRCPKCGEPARRENDTMDTFVCSSWYYLRYVDPHNSQVFAAPEKLAEWLPVDLYMGGAEHAVMHLLYVRFFAKVLEKYGYVKFNEPFLKLRHQGIILGEDGNKMSKSKGNVVNPDDLVERQGADALRVYEMFMGPLEDMKPWNSQGIVGVSRFLDKVYSLGNSSFSQVEDKKILSLLHKTIKKIGADIENFRFNTAVSALMILTNALTEQKSRDNIVPLSKDGWQKFLLILAPFAPHLADELWEKSGNPDSIFRSAWPEYDQSLAKDETVNLVVQVNGKLRATLAVAADISESEALAMAKEQESIKKWLEGKKAAKVIFVPGRLLNIVIE